jgi:chloramphenicol 3-O-phosphotransferase
MKFLTYIQKIFFVSLLIASINTQSASAWILVFNGTSSSGKTTLAKNFQKIAQEKSEILQYDIEADLLLKETLENLGYKYDTKLSIREWFESLPKEVQKKIDDVDDDVAWTSIQKRIVEKAQKFNQKGINVIIDTGLKSKDDYNLFVNGLSTKNTYFVLVYAPISQLLKNLEARNNSGNKGEERNPLGPFFQYFWFLSKKCDTKSC